MLHEFLTENRKELISRCRGKVSRRVSPPVTPSELERGVPLFLAQLVEALRDEETNPARKHDGILDVPGMTSAAGESTRAALHGKALHEEGYTVDQVVHGYGDICQAVTELAKEKNAPVTIDEFHTLDRLLDNAIADAVSSYGQRRESISVQDAQDTRERLAIAADELRRLADKALKAFETIKAGNIGLGGATGILLEDSLRKLRDLVDKSLPATPLSTATTPPPKPRRRLA